MPRGLEEWQRIRAEGRARFLLRHGVLGRGVPMALGTVLLIQVLKGDLDAELLATAEFHRMLLVALILFSLGGILSAYARWKSLEARFEDES